jgi:hypothetical protein
VIHRKIKKIKKKNKQEDQEDQEEKQSQEGHGDQEGCSGPTAAINAGNSPQRLNRNDQH